MFKTEFKNAVASFKKNSNNAFYSVIGNITSSEAQIYNEREHQYECPDCLELTQVISSNNVEKMFLTNELLISQNLINNLQAQVSQLEQKCSYLSSIIPSKNNEQLQIIKILEERDKTIFNLNKELFEQNYLFKMNNLRNCEQSIDTNLSNLKSHDIVDINNITSSLEKLEFESRAYKMQNQLLNTEILNISEILQAEDDKNDKSQIQITKLEALCYELELKCSTLIRELNLNNIDIPSHIISQTDESNENYLLSSIINKCDNYGFKIFHIDDHSSFKTITENLHNFSTLKQNKKTLETETNLIKWETMLLSCTKNEQSLSNNIELKNLLRLGCPVSLRARIWKILINMRVGNYKSSHDAKSYRDLLDIISFDKSLISYAHQVEIDLLRTMPNNVNFERLDSAKVSPLRNILLAFSLHNPDVGYCQGLNQIGAILLLVLEEEDAFWGLVDIVDFIMPSRYYDRTLIAAHADQRVLKDFVNDKFPQLSLHFNSQHFELSLFTFSWFLTIFASCLPIETTLRVWDVFLFEGSKVLFRFALATLKYFESDLLSMQEAKLFSFAQTMSMSVHDSNKFFQLAFNDMNPLSMWTVKLRRNQHIQKLNLELEELNKLRNSLEKNLTLYKDSSKDDLSD